VVFLALILEVKKWTIKI